jgi:isoleucyl-tRNA synthetase
MTIPLVNELDRWVLSKLQVLIAQVHDAMDGYDVSRACRAIVEYMDELTNWYVRLSRRRFWESGMTADKASAYTTLHSVLAELSKLLAPFMPFLSESIFQGLTNRDSVHLEHITRPNRHLIDSPLNRDMEICEHIVSLGLALRSQKNIRVRQPLQYVTITAELSEYYQSIIRDELNVKEVRYENPEKLAKKICKPDARKIGPKYGKDVQKVIMEAKNGNFIEKENGIIDV